MAKHAWANTIAKKSEILFPKKLINYKNKKVSGQKNSVYPLTLLFIVFLEAKVFAVAHFELRTATDDHLVK